MGQSGQAVAVDRGAFEIERGRGFAHGIGQMGLDRLALAGQKRLGLGDQLVIIRFADFIGARAGAALDLVEQAGTRAVFVEGIRAGRSRKARCSALIVRPTAPAEAKGPK